MSKCGSSFLAHLSTVAIRQLADIPLVVAEEGVGDIQSELTFFLQQIDTTTPSSK
jgi:hypothetical protein